MMGLGRLTEAIHGSKADGIRTELIAELSDSLFVHHLPLARL